MKKKQKNGFVLMETLIVSTLILTTLVFLYLEFKSVKNKYDYSFKYDTVPGIYNAKEIADYLNEVGYTNLTNLLSDSTQYIDITSSSSINGSSNVYNQLIDDMGITTIIFTKNKLSSFKSYLNSDSCNKAIFDDKFKRYILSLNDGENNGYMIIIKFNDKSYARYALGEKNESNGESTPNNNEPESHSGPTLVAATSNDTHKGIVYLDPTNLSNTCDESNSTVGSGNSGCMKFYIYDDSGDNYKMILDHNTENGVAWSTTGWNYTYTSSGAYPSIQNLITNNSWDSSLNPTLITIDEINTITGKTGFDSTTTNSWYYLDSLNQTQSANSQGASRYAWLFDYTNGCTSYGCNFEVSVDGTTGYWTVDTVGTAGSGSNVWRMSNNGTLYGSYAYTYVFGVRPVITIPKSSIN